MSHQITVMVKEPLSSSTDLQLKCVSLPPSTDGLHDKGIYIIILVLICILDYVLQEIKHSILNHDQHGFSDSESLVAPFHLSTFV